MVQKTRAATYHDAFRRAQAWLLEKPAAWADLPCGRSDGPAASHKDALLESERLYHRRLIDHLHEKIHGEYLRCEERDRDNGFPCWRLDRFNERFDKERERATLAKKRVGELERSIVILHWRLERRIEIPKAFRRV